MTRFIYRSASGDNTLVARIRNKIDFYSLVSPLSIGIATDVVLPGIKNNVVFNAYNSIRAQALFMPEFTEVPDNLLAKFYEAFPTHADFPILVEQLEEVKETVQINCSSP